MDKNKHYVVIGLGGSGLATVNYLYDKTKVSVVDANNNPPLSANLPDLPKNALHFGGIDEAVLLSADVIVISPGVNPTHPAIIKSKSANIPIISDVQLFVNECRDRGIKIVAITGSNAKSTVTTLVGQMAKDAGMRVGVGGNIGIPALELLKSPIEVAVLELSSFQLEGISNLGAQVATILNLSPDHLDRHGDMTTYLNEKLKIFDKAHSAVIFGDDEDLAKACLMHIKKNATKGAMIDMVSQQNSIDGNADICNHYHLDDNLALSKNQQVLLSADKLLIKGTHNLSNALFALAIGDKMGLAVDGMLTTLQAFEGLAHRCQFVACIDGVDYFNDSKGTNVGAAQAAILGTGQVYGDNRVAVILGGQAKGQNFGELIPMLNKYAHSVLVFGQDTQKIADDLSAITPPIILCEDLTQTVNQARVLGASCVLLSPACASFDMFEGYEHRGRSFCELVNKGCDE